VRERSTEHGSSNHGGTKIIRQIGFGMLALVTLAVAFGLQPEGPEPTNTSRFDRQVQQALADFDLNESRTAGAPQRQVVNGWVNRDLLTIIPRQLSASMEQPSIPVPDPRIAYLLLILTLTAIWHGSTAHFGAGATVVAEPGSSDPSPPPPSAPGLYIDEPPEGADR